MTETKIEGRDMFLLKKALAIAVCAIERARDQFKPVSDQRDMKELLRRLVENEDELANLARQAREIVGGGDH